MTNGEGKSETEMRNENEEIEINLLDYLIVLAKRKGLIVIITFGLMFIVAIYSLVVSPVYKAETKILPPQQASSSMAAQLLSQLGSAGGVIGGVSVMKTPNELYVALLKSNTVLDRVIERFDIIKTEKLKTKTDARKFLLDRMKTQDDKKSGIITIGIEDKNPTCRSQLAEKLCCHA